MIIDYANELVFLSNTKVASTSLEAALLSGRRMGKIDGHPSLKHISFSDYRRIMYVLKTGRFKTLCVVRHPVEKAKSWYKYRSRDKLVGSPRSTKGIPLETFLSTILEPEFDDRHFVYDEKSGTSVDYIFKYEHLDKLENFLKSLYGDTFRLEHKNKSPEIALDDIPPATLKRFQNAVDWYATLPDAPELPI